MRTKRTKLNIYILIAAYLGIIAIFIASILFMPKWVNRFENQYIEKLEYKIYETIRVTPMEELEPALQKLYAEDAIELAVYQDNKAIIRTIPGDGSGTLQGAVNTKAIVAETKGTIERADGKKLGVWYVIYRPLLQGYMSNLTIYQIGFLMLSFLILLTVILSLQFITIKPLTQLKKSIQKLENYDLENIQQNSDDVMNESVGRFAVNLKQNIQAVSRTHSALEQALQLERERLSNLMTISRGLIHDLKTPVHQTLMENDLVLKKVVDTNPQTKIITEYNIERMEKIILRINDILNLMDTDVKGMMEVKNEFDVIDVFKNIRTVFENDLQNHALYLVAEIPEKLPVRMSKVAIHLIIHNLLSNAVKYGLPDSEIELGIYEESGQLIIECRNMTLEKNIERIQKSEDLFYSVKNESDTGDAEYVYSTGNGLYLIKELTNILHGAYELQIEENEIIIHAVLPIQY